ncbi:hypothetical protein [Cycloclasticus zancles]|uniref:Uncharacterized protein n=1 Tax=Cycloclasticus zancles 78-ME TaxID=1198232 RepID=S5T7S0_9GAMM|nr:hypothetical protein [Cycloclasticus zancles]AGS39644.1 hypothetical protein CYCME_1315 [Cycloclasticus zancles 78-ME]
MKKLITAIALTAALSTPVFAVDAHQHSSNKSGNQTQVQMHDHMKSMQKLMADIKQEKSSAKRHKMMQDHMQSMQKGMNMMGNGDMSPVKLDTRVGMLEERIKMMQAMMVQMMDYSAQAEDRAFKDSITEGGSVR